MTEVNCRFIINHIETKESNMSKAFFAPCVYLKTIKFKIKLEIKSEDNKAIGYHSTDGKNLYSSEIK